MAALDASTAATMAAKMGLRDLAEAAD